ncbi:hypothetical protein [Devosia sp. 1635]|uniref:hypothetical protein n=1 Tax=Devosia sp. 1635 TaxID=2726066 RepID=UPI0015633321|nr:hypothetical protein [Devosia sp. 1635]
MSEITQLLTRIEAHCARESIAESTFGRLAVNDGKLVARLRAGGSINLRTFSAIQTFLDATVERVGEAQS